MASLKFRHYATESDLKGTGEIQNALNAFDVGTIVFIDDTQKQYIITGKNNNVVTYKIYYGKAAIVGVTGTGATRTLTFSDGSKIIITINDVEHATTSDSCSGNAKSATTLQTARKINGTNFNGSADITTSKWGEFRNIGIVNSDGTGTAVTVSVNGSSNVNLKLPEIIKANLDGNASSATKATNDGSGNAITSTYATKTERANNDITTASLSTTALTLTRASGNITANIPTWNQNTTGTAAKATADANGNNIVNTYATKAEVAALPKSMVIKGTLDAGHTLPTSGMTEGDTYIVGAKGTYNNIACKVGDFFVRTSDSWLRIPAGDEWEYNENTIKGIKVNNAGHADTADTAVSAGSATSDGNGDNIANTYARIDKVYSDSSAYRQFLGKGGSSTDWIRTTESGIIPYTSGDSANGHSMLGTPSWYFSKAYIQNIYGYLNGNISGSSTSCSGNSATATKLQTARTIWGQSFDGSGNVSGALTEVTSITASGNVTIGGAITIDKKDTLLSLYSLTEAGIMFQSDGSGGDVAVIYEHKGVGNGLTFAEMNRDFIWRTGASAYKGGGEGTERMRLTNGGNVGIGTTSPTSKLHVDGTGYFTSDISSASNIIAGGYIKGETVKISSGCTLQYDSAQKCVKFVFS